VGRHEARDLRLTSVVSLQATRLCWLAYARTVLECLFTTAKGFMSWRNMLLGMLQKKHLKFVTTGSFEIRRPENVELILRNIWLMNRRNKLQILFFYFPWFSSPARAMASSFSRFRDHTQRCATVGRTPLDEWSVAYCSVLHKHETGTVG
jgi:hypothetical protein